MSDFFRKTARYRSLSVDCYAVLTDPCACSVLRFAPGGNDVENWTDRPIAGVGGLSIDVVDDAIVVVTPTGRVIRHDFDLSRDAERRVADLEARLRAAGIEP